MQLSKEVKRKVRGYNGWGIVGGGRSGKGGRERKTEKSGQGGVHKEEGRRGEGREKALFILDS